MKNPITPEGAASARNPLPPVPTTKILAISHFIGTPMTPAQRAQGEQGFMIIQIFDHGADLLLVGQRRKAKQYLIGNPLLAIQVNRYDIRAALYAPLRVLVFESAPGRTVVEFDQPSTLFGQFGQSEVTAVGVEDDGKLDRVIAKAAMI